MKQKVISISFVIFIIGLSLLSFIFKDNELSKFERRKLAQAPKLDKKFIKNLDAYILDQFPFRNEFINLNSNINRNILQMKGYNDVYVIDDIIYEINYPLNDKQCMEFCNKINYIIEKSLQNSNVYYSIIPDKEYFLNDENYLKIDYNLLQDKIKLQAKYINIMNSLSIEDYYNTDIHWKQENLDEVVKNIVEQMGNTYQQIDYEYETYDNFYGTSYSKAGSNIAPDKLTYLYNNYTENSTVKHLEYGDKPVYDKQKLESLDLYNIFLSGASSYIEITNQEATNEKELIIFRDSYASSLAPLLIPYYSKITLIDLRYINYDIVKNIVDFNNKDVLFIYSVQVINNSNLLKVNNI